MTSQFERRIEWQPAYDKRSDDPKKDYGVHGLTIRFLLIGENGATQFVLYTNWQLPHVTEQQKGYRYESSRGDPHWMERPMPVDLGYHSPVPQYEGQTAMKCDLLPAGECYYDGSSLRAEPVFHRLLAEGDAGVWAALEEEYLARFEVGPAEPTLGETLSAISRALRSNGEEIQS